MSHRKQHYMQKSLSPGELRVQLNNALERIARLEADNQEMALAIMHRNRLIGAMRDQIDQLRQPSGILLPGAAKHG